MTNAELAAYYGTVAIALVTGADRGDHFSPGEYGRLAGHYGRASLAGGFLVTEQPKMPTPPPGLDTRPAVREMLKARAREIAIRSQRRARPKPRRLVSL